MNPSPTESTTFDVSPWADSIRPYADWIDRVDPGTAKAWVHRLLRYDYQCLSETPRAPQDRDDSLSQKAARNVELHIDGIRIVNRPGAAKAAGEHSGPGIR
ncbi:MAG: hypothetical protein GY722_16345 [bacterium]|nr:hypothetical protein [bacterium]